MLSASIFSTSAGQCDRRGLPLRALSGCVPGYGVSGPQVLVCSDAMTRGMDVENVANVISYDAPVYAKVTAAPADSACIPLRSC